MRTNRWPVRPAGAARRGSSDTARDTGLTLVELLVAMAIFTAVIGVFMGGLVTMTKGTSHAQGTSNSSDELRRAFQRMDKEVRYASAVNRPGTVGSDEYVEFLTKAVPTGQAPTCTQWRYRRSTGQLQTRSWADGASAATAGWVTIATGLSNPAAVPAFSFQPAGAVRSKQRLAVELQATKAHGGAQIKTEFVARNSSTSSVNNMDADGDGASDTNVCLAPGSRA